MVASMKVRHLVNPAVGASRCESLGARTFGVGGEQQTTSMPSERKYREAPALSAPILIFPCEPLTSRLPDLLKRLIVNVSRNLTDMPRGLYGLEHSP